MDFLAIQRIESCLGRPLIDPGRIHAVDALDIADALEEITEMCDDSDALSGATDALVAVAFLIKNRLKKCRACRAGTACARHQDFRAWLSDAPAWIKIILDGGAREGTMSAPVDPLSRELAALVGDVTGALLRLRAWADRCEADGLVEKGFRGEIEARVAHYLTP